MAFMYSEEIIKEITKAVSGIQTEEVLALEKEIRGAARVFCDGQGRSGLCCRGFAMRLTHLGLTSFFVGETTVPAAGPGDLLLICSGSGESETLVSRARIGKKNGMRLAVITGDGGSALGELADVCIVIDSPRKDDAEAGDSTILPMGSLFEGAAFLFFENIVLALMGQMGETSQSMFKRHANLE